MDEDLKKYKPVPPPPGLKDKVLEAAERERKRTLPGRILGSGRFWLGVAAAVLLSVVLFVVAESWTEVPGPVHSADVAGNEVKEKPAKGKVSDWLKKLREYLP